MKAFPLLLLLWPSAVCAQLNETFDDGDFTHNPDWSGHSELWEISEGRLHSRLQLNTSESKTFYLSTPSSRVTGTVWKFWVKLGLNTSSKNFVRIHLTAQNADPRNTPDYGYSVVIGGTEDRISLFRKDSLTNVALIKGRSGITDHSKNTINVKVICDRQHHWTLYTDLSGTGMQYIPEGTAIDSTYLQSRYFSIEVRQSGKGASQKHWFDDIFIQPYLPDTVPPVLSKIIIKDTHHLQLRFSEALSTSVENKLHYTIDQKVNPDSVYLLPANPTVLLLYFKRPFRQKEAYSLVLHGITDLTGNILDTSAHFTFFQPDTYDVIIDEIYPDPTPSHGLPEDEYAELFNASGFPVDLKGWQFCDPVRCAVLPEIVLPADSFLILCDKKYKDHFLAYGKTLGLESFPSLNNTNDELTLKNANGKIIYAISYNKKSYDNDEKAKGGWSIEMKSPDHPCLVSGNWSASAALYGGTPGAINTTNDEDRQSFLDLEYVDIIDSVTLRAGLNAGLDPMLTDAAYFTLDNKTIDSAKVAGPLFTSVYLHLQNPLEKRKVYTLSTHNLTGCGLASGLKNSLQFGLPEPPQPGDLFINEILFNPRKDGSDFIELYNASKKIIDIRSLQLANRNKENEPASVTPVSSVPFYVLPGQYVAITTDKQNILQQYFCKTPKNLVETDKMPSYPNVSGSILLIDTSGQLLDEVAYNENRQYALFHNNEGASLEKINTTGPSSDPDNWASASSVTGYATPAYQNSQAATETLLTTSFKAIPEIFSPDGDGSEDQTFLKYTLKPGYSAKILIYNENGTLVRQLRSHVSLGTHNQIPWNGKDDKGHVLSTGIYIFYIALYHPSGAVGHIKLPVVLAKRR